MGVARKSVDNKIAVYTQIINGFGDVMFAARLASQLSAKGYEVDLVGLDSETQEALKTLQIPKLNIKNLKDVSAQDYGMSMLGPGVVEVGTLLPKFKNQHVMVFSEYDFDTSVTDLVSNQLKRQNISCEVIPTGIGDKCKGILLDTELVNVKTFDPNVLNNLKNTNLKEELLGSRSSVDYFKNKDLSFAYTSYQDSLNAVNTHIAYAALNKSNKPHDIVLVSSSESSLQTNPQKYLDALTKQFGDKVASIELVNTDSGEKVSAKGNNEGGRPIRILYASKLAHEDMIKLQKASGENLITVTGDQSLSEAISRGKVFNYVLGGHKSGLLQSLFNVAQKFSDKIKTVIKDHFNTNRLTDPEKAAKDLNNAKADFSKFCDHIKKEKNLLNYVVPRIEKVKQMKNEAKSAPVSPELDVLQMLSTCHQLILNHADDRRIVREILQQAKNKLDNNSDLKPIIDHVIRTGNVNDSISTIKAAQLHLMVNDRATYQSSMRKITNEVEDPLLASKMNDLFDNKTFGQRKVM